MSPPRTQALAKGVLGVALLHVERGDLVAARPLLAEAVADGVSTGSNASLFHGAPALEFVLGRAGRADRDVQDVVDRIVAARLASAARRRESAPLPHLAEFDLIRGLTGLGATAVGPCGLATSAREGADLACPVNADGLLPGWSSQDGPAHEEISAATATALWRTASLALWHCCPSSPDAVPR